MALSRVTVWVAGQVLTAAALNGEFNSILNNPISLVSPTTGAINFNLQAHTNLVVSALSATSASPSQFLITTTGNVAVWGPTAGTSGQILSVTTSGLPAWVNAVRVLQVVNGNAAGPVNAATTSFADSGIAVAITPASTASRIAVSFGMTGTASNLAGVNNAYQAQLATSTGALSGTQVTISALSGAGGGGSIGGMAWNVVYNSTATAPVTFKVQHLFTASSGVNSGNFAQFNGYLTELSS